jgi:hypothetical protein
MWTRHPPCPQSHEAEQNQKKRTFDVLPKPDKLIRYRQANVDSLADGRVAGCARLGEADHRALVGSLVSDACEAAAGAA